jgi:protein involved in polysaccharide export with SLBB domain
LLATGCHLVNLEPTQPLHWEERVADAGGPPVVHEASPTTTPRELQKITLPEYVIEAPDILLVDAVKVIPRPPYRIESLDVLQIAVEGTPADQPISGFFTVDTDGKVQLGAAYGSVKVAGMTIEEAAVAVERLLRGAIGNPKVTVNLAQTVGQQQINGQHIVGPDGKVNLGMYGRVRLTGLTVREARAAIEQHLSQWLLDPKVSVDLLAYNSKTYYVVLEGAGNGDRIERMPITGNDTVLDAIAQVGGMNQLSSRNIWIARPAPGHVGCDQILPVNWREVTRGGSAKSNYQVLPGDRIFIAEDRMMAFSSTVDRLSAPFERMFGLILLGTQTIQTMQRFPDGLF